MTGMDIGLLYKAGRKAVRLTEECQAAGHILGSSAGKIGRDHTKEPPRINQLIEHFLHEFIEPPNSRSSPQNRDKRKAVVVARENQRNE